jgi:predicted transcriptional regulator
VDDGRAARVSDPRLELLTYTYGFMVTQAIAATARAGIADLVAEQPRAVADLAAEAGYSEDVLRRILRALAALGIFQLSEEGLVSNTPTSEFLRAEVDGSVNWIAQSFAAEHFLTWTEADTAFRTGKSVAADALGAPYFDWLAEHPAEAAIFNRAMAAGSAIRARALVERDWSDELVVDVGGGTGGLVIGLLTRHPRLRGVVVDLPHSGELAGERFEAAEVADRAEFVSGDFFSEVPAGADVYLLSQILHDWDDEAATRILRACRAASKPTSRLLISTPSCPKATARRCPSCSTCTCSSWSGGGSARSANGASCSRPVASHSTVSTRQEPFR